MDTMHECMKRISQLFRKYASKDGEGSTLNKREFKLLIEKECPDLYKKFKVVPEGIDFFKTLDQNEDDLIDFSEFMAMVLSFLITTHSLDKPQQPAQPMATLEDYVKNLNHLFHKHASRDGNATLNKGEFKSLMQNEFPDLCKKNESNNELMEMFKGLDENGDNAVDFREFIVILVMFLTLTHFVELMESMEQEAK